MTPRRREKPPTLRRHWVCRSLQTGGQQVQAGHQHRHDHEAQSKVGDVQSISRVVFSLPVIA